MSQPAKRTNSFTYSILVDEFVNRGTGGKGHQEDNTAMRRTPIGFFSVQIVAQCRLCVAGKVEVVVGLWGEWME